MPPPLDHQQIAKNLVESARKMSKMGVIFNAEISGPSRGAGNEILLQMDMRFAAPGTKLGSLEVRPGMLHAAGGAQYLTKLIGSGRALEYLLRPTLWMQRLPNVSVGSTKHFLPSKG